MKLAEEVNSMTNEQLIERLNWRYAVKRFDPARKISDDDWATLEQSLLLAPSSYGLQPWRFYVITDEQVKIELRQYSYDQPQIEECSHLVIFAARKNAGPEDIERYLDRVIDVRGTKREELEILSGMMHGSQKQAVEQGTLNEWAARQCFISLGFLLSASAVLEIDACPMEGFLPAEYDKHLKINDEGYFSVVACSLGYRDSNNDWLLNLDKVRYDPSEVIKKI